VVIELLVPLGEFLASGRRKAAVGYLNAECVIGVQLSDHAFDITVAFSGLGKSGNGGNGT
jgi:hypothetical protein